MEHQVVITQNAIDMIASYYENNDNTDSIFNTLLSEFGVISAVDIINKDCSESIINNKSFNYCSFNDCEFENSLFVDVIFKKVDFSNCTFNYSSFNNVKFSGCKLNFSDMCCSDFTNVLIEDCEVISVSFDKSKISNCRFDTSNFKDSIFDESTINNFSILYSEFEHVDFEDAIINDILFTRTNLYKSSFRNCQINNYKFDRCNLADIRGDFEMMSITNLGPFGWTLTFSQKDGIIWFGDFDGNLEDFQEKLIPKMEKGFPEWVKSYKFTHTFLTNIHKNYKEIKDAQENN